MELRQRLKALPVFQFTTTMSSVGSSIEYLQETAARRVAHSGLYETYETNAMQQVALCLPYNGDQKIAPRVW